MNQLRRVQGLAYPTQASRSADVKTGEIAGKEPGVPTVRRDWHPDPLADLPTATARRRGAPVTPAKHHFATEPLLLVHWKSALIPEWNRQLPLHRFLSDLPLIAHVPCLDPALPETGIVPASSISMSAHFACRDGSCLQDVDTPESFLPHPTLGLYLVIHQASPLPLSHRGILRHATCVFPPVEGSIEHNTPNLTNSYSAKQSTGVGRST